MSRFAAEHPHWTGFLLLSDTDDRIEHEEFGCTGRYWRDGEFLDVHWDRYGYERYMLKGQVWTHQQLIDQGQTLDDMRHVSTFGATLQVTGITVKIPRRDYEVTLRPGTSDSSAFWQVFLNEDYDSPCLPGNASTIIDLGANIGLAAAYFGLRYPDARIVALEPDASNFAQLCRNTAVLGNRVTCLHAAIWQEDGTINLHTEDASGAALGAWGVRVSAQESGANARTRAIRLETLLQQTGMLTVDILKIDIEGAELELFTARPELWLERVNLIIVETHDRFRPGSDAAVRAALAGQFEMLPAVGENQYFLRRGVRASLPG